MGSWVTGHNLPGYLPESDTYAVADWRQAADALALEMREYADENDEAAYAHLTATANPADYPDHENSGYGDDEPSMRATVDSILADDGPCEVGKDWSGWVADSDDRQIVFWLAWSDDREPDEDE